MNKKLLTPCAIFIAFNLIVNILFFFIDKNKDAIMPMLWLSCFLLTYAIFFFSKPDTKLNWLVYGVYFSFIGYCLNETTFKNFAKTNYNFDQFFSYINNSVFNFITKQTEGYLNNFSDFAINLNIFSLGIIIFGVIYIIFFKNKYINQVLCENLFLCVLLFMILTTIFPVKTTSDVFNNIGNGDLAFINDKISSVTHYFIFSTISLQIMIFTFLSLYLVKENWFIGLTLFLILILLLFSHIALNYSKFSEVLLAVIIAFFVYFTKVQKGFKTYMTSISFA